MTGGAALAPDLSRAVTETFGCALLDAVNGTSEAVGGEVSRGHNSSSPRSVGPACPAGGASSSISRRLRLGFGDPGGGHGPEPQRHARVPRRRGDARRPRPRRLAAHGRRRLPRLGRVPLPRGPKEGIVIRSGYSVYPREVEDVLCASRRAGSGGGGHPRRRARRGGGRAYCPAPMGGESIPGSGEGVRPRAARRLQLAAPPFRGPARSRRAPPASKCRPAGAARLQVAAGRKPANRQTGNWIPLARLTQQPAGSGSFLSAALCTFCTQAWACHPSLLVQETPPRKVGTTWIHSPIERSGACHSSRRLRSCSGRPEGTCRSPP